MPFTWSFTKRFRVQFTPSVNARSPVEKIVSARELRNGASVPPALSNLVMECVSTRPQKRPADMDAMITRLELSKHILMKERNPAGAQTPAEEFPDQETRFGKFRAP